MCLCCVYMKMAHFWNVEVLIVFLVVVDVVYGKWVSLVPYIFNGLNRVLILFKSIKFSPNRVNWCRWYILWHGNCMRWHDIPQIDLSCVRLLSRKKMRHSCHLILLIIMGWNINGWSRFLLSMESYKSINMHVTSVDVNNWMKHKWFFF